MTNGKTCTISPVELSSRAASLKKEAHLLFTNWNFKWQGFTSWGWIADEYLLKSFAIPVVWLFHPSWVLSCSSLARMIWLCLRRCMGGVGGTVHPPPMIWLITSSQAPWLPTTPAPKICGKEGFGRLALIGFGNRGEEEMITKLPQEIKMKIFVGTL